MAGTLYIIATPIGNLRDITYRAVDTLSNVDVILAEDKRVTGKLLKEYNIDPNKFISFHHHSKEQKKLEILNMLIKDKSIALVTDAGTPGVSDPGNELLHYLLEKDPTINIVPIPGPSALTTALSVSGMNVNRFLFLGFMPKKKRSKLFKWLKEGDIPFAFYESPHRILRTLKMISQEFGKDTEVFIGRELTKLHETLYRGTVKDLVRNLQKDSVKGEFVVVVDPD